MAKATLVCVHEKRSKKYREFMCWATAGHTDEEFALKYVLAGTYDGDWVPQAGDNVQYFGNEISKIVSRPVPSRCSTIYNGTLRDDKFNNTENFQDGHLANARWKKSVKQKGTKMRHSVNIRGMAKGCLPTAGSLQLGAICHYPQGICLYIKIRDVVGCHQKPPRVELVHLETGAIYDCDPNKPLVAVKSGTQIKITVGENNS